MERLDNLVFVDEILFRPKLTTKLLKMMFLQKYQMTYLFFYWRKFVYIILYSKYSKKKEKKEKNKFPSWKNCSQHQIIEEGVGCCNGNSTIL